MTKWNRRAALFIALGVFGGPAACSEEPRRSHSSSDPECGDGDREDDEVCDGGDLDGATCESLGFGAGPLKCAPNCGEFDRSACGAPQTCGNGGKDGVELCDGADLAGTTCPALGYGEGTLACTANCADFDVSGCGAPQTCGNGEKDGVEACDGKDLGGATCESVGKDSGALACSPDCLSYDTSGCACTPVCGGLTRGPDPKCGVSCGECDGFSVCEAGACVKACDLAPITADTALDLDLKTVTLSGTITLNGAEMPDDVVNSSYPRGYLTLVDTTTKHVSYFSFGETGPVNYSLQVFASTYDVHVESNTSYEQSVLPSDQKIRVQKGCSN